MKKLSLLVFALIACCNVWADTITVREPGIIEGLVVGSGGIVTGLVGMTKDLLVGRTITYTTPAGVPVTAPVATVPPCTVVTPAPVVYTQPAVIPSAPPVVVTPAVQPVVAVAQTAVVPYQTTVVYLPYRGWGPPPLRPRHYYHPCPPPYPGPYCRPALR